MTAIIRRRGKDTSPQVTVHTSVVMIPCNQIAIPPLDREIRSRSAKGCQSLAESIKQNGLLQPIGVKENPEGSAKLYTLVFGRHRLHAFHKILGKKEIPAVVIASNQSETEYEMTGIAENIFRTPPNRAQLLVARQRWFNDFMSHHPEYAKSPDEEESPKSPNESNAAEFARQLAEATGRTARQARREVRIYKGLKEKEIQDLTQAGVTQSDLEAVASVEEEPAKEKVIDAILTKGVDPADAVDQFAPPKSKARGAIRLASKVRAAGKREESAETSSDEQWFQTTCSEKAKLFANPARYKSDAILFHRIMEHRAAFRAKIHKSMSEPRSTGVKGPLFYAINRALSIMPPTEWKICSSCGGKGVLTDAQGEKRDCLKCRGACYELTTENML